jgi:hypothetical protein
MNGRFHAQESHSGGKPFEPDLSPGRGIAGPHGANLLFNIRAGFRPYHQPQEKKLK